MGQLLTSPLERCVSTLLDRDGHGLRRLLLSAVALGLADTPDGLLTVLGRTLLAVQSDTLQVGRSQHPSPGSRGPAVMDGLVSLMFVSCSQ